jgi:hypothetical protein
LVPLVAQNTHLDASGNLVEARLLEVDTYLCPDIHVTARYFNQVPTGMWPGSNYPMSVNAQPINNNPPSNASHYLAEREKEFEASYAAEAGHRAIEAQVSNNLELYICSSKHDLTTYNRLVSTLS